MNRCRPKGFTLLEILVTLTIIVTIVSMVYGSYVAAAKATQGYSQRLSSLQRSHLALRQCERVLRNCYLPETSASQTSSQTQGLNTHTKQVTVAPWFHGQHQASGSCLSFVTQRSMHAEGTYHTPLARLHLQYSPGARTLSLATQPFDQAESPPLMEPSREILVTGVSTCTFRFYDGQQWHTQWDSSKAKTLPQAIEIELAVQTQSQSVQGCRTLIPIPCFRPASNPGSGGVSL
jgi:prepilin-type N-terminal cleavage/methylation domain-containing protein